LGRTLRQVAEELADLCSDCATELDPETRGQERTACPNCGSSPSVPAILDDGMRVRVDDPWGDRLPLRALGDVGMWALVPLLLSLGGGFLIYVGIFAGELPWEVFAGAAAAFVGLTSAALMYARGGIAALVLIAVGAFGGWVWEQFRDGASIDAVTYVGGGYDGSHWVGNVDNYEERAATVTCQLEALSPEGDVIGTVEVTATNVRPNGGRSLEGEIDVPPLTGAAAQAERITAHRNLRSTCTTEIG
jgi:hypothetical protein